MKTPEQLAKLKKKIQLLLNKAANTPYPAEAQAFQEHAERLMVRHSIDSLDGVEDQKFTTLSLKSTGTYRVVAHQSKTLMAYAFPHFTCFQTISGKHERQKYKILTLVGTPSELEKFGELMASLERQCSNAMSNHFSGYQFPYGVRPVTLKRSFMLGFYGKVAERFRALFDEEASSSTALVRVNTEAEAWMLNNFKLSAASTRKTGAKELHLEGLTAGMEAGERADIGQSKVTGQGALT